MQRGGGLAVACIAGVGTSVSQLAAAQLQDTAPTHGVDAAAGPWPQFLPVLPRECVLRDARRHPAASQPPSPACSSSREGSGQGVKQGGHSWVLLEGI